MRASIHDERYAQLPIMTAELEADRQDGTEAVFTDDPETCNSRTPYPGWALNFLSSALSTVEMVWFIWGLCNALPFDTISELCCRAVWGVAVWNEAPPIFGGLNRYQRRVEVLRKTYTSNVSASCMSFVNDVLRRTLPDSENDLIAFINDGANLVTYVGIFGFSHVYATAVLGPTRTPTGFLHGWVMSTSEVSHCQVCRFFHSFGPCCHRC
jgi:hypothetical protein